MGSMIVRDNAIWISHIQDAPELVEKARNLNEGEPIDLLINGHPARFLRMSRGKDGRPTPGLKPSAGSSPFWRGLQEKRGERISIDLASPAIYDSYLLSLTSLLSEWDSDDDNEAYDNLPTS